jgi:hypothetical protein
MSPRLEQDREDAAVPLHHVLVSNLETWRPGSAKRLSPPLSARRLAQRLARYSGCASAATKLDARNWQTIGGDRRGGSLRPSSTAPLSWTPLSKPCVSHPESSMADFLPIWHGQTERVDS